MQTQYDSWNIVELYASPYLVVNQQEYTKHIYAGSKRIVSKLAVGLESSIVDPFDFTVEYDGEYGELGTALQEYLDNNLSCTDIKPENVGHNFDLEVIQQNHATPASEVESDIYFYHTDHLGSSSWITYSDGSVTQHLQNLPFGEPFIDQRATSYDVSFKFIGKEMDTETGYQYFGARYYDSDISVWLSVDPMAHMREWVSPYNFVQNNPINRTDPTGALDDWYKNENGDVFHQDGHAESITVDGQEYKNIGSTYTKGQYGNNYHYVQDELVSITGTETSFGETMQSPRHLRNAASTASYYDTQTVQEVFDKAYHYGTTEMGKETLKGMGIVVGNVIGADYLLAGGIIATEFWAGKATISAGTQAIFNKGDIDVFDVAISTVTTPGAGALFGGLVDVKSTSGIQVTGINKSGAQTVIDIGSGAVGGKLGHKGYNSVKPYLINGTEKGLMNTTVSIPASVMGSGINKSITERRNK